MTEGMVARVGRNTLPSRRLLRGQFGADLMDAASWMRIVTVATTQPPWSVVLQTLDCIAKRSMIANSSATWRGLFCHRPQPTPRDALSPPAVV